MPGSRSRVVMASGFRERLGGCGQYSYDGRRRALLTSAAMSALRRAAPTLAALALALWPRRLRRQHPPASDDRPRRLPPAEASDRRRVRNARGAGESRQARRPQDHAFGRGAARQYAAPARRSAVHTRRRSGPGRELPRAVCRGTDRRSQGSRHRPRRPARHRTLVAARLRGVQARPQPQCRARFRSRAQGNRMRARARRERHRRLAIHDGGVGGRSRCGALGAGLRQDQSLGRLVRDARRAGISAPLPATTCAASCSTASRRRR